MDDETLEQEQSRAGRLQRMRKKSLASGGQKPDGGSNKKEITVFESFLFTSFVFVLFDLPQIILTFIGIGFLVNWLIGIFGWLTIYIWMKLKGYSIFAGKKGDDVVGLFFGSAIIDTLSVFLPAMTAFVVIFIIKTKAKKVLEKVPGESMALKTTEQSA